MTKSNKQFWDLLSALNIESVSVEFSGGNDSGGTGEILARRKDNSTISFEELITMNSADSNVSALIEWLCAPVYDKYRSFAGEFYTSGEVIFDVETRTAEMQYTETTEEYFTDVVIDGELSDDETEV